MTDMELQEAFIEAMVEQQEFVEELEVINSQGFMDIHQHPFDHNDTYKLCDFFDSSIAEHHEVTSEIIVTILSNYSSKINKLLKGKIDE